MRKILILLRKTDATTSMKETLTTIARRIGCSTTTVSRVLSGKAEQCRISEETVLAVLKEARRCNYTPSATAQSLRTNKSKTIGMLLPSVSNPYFADMASVIISELDKNNYTTIVVDTMEDGKHLMESARSLIARQVDGLIAVPCDEDRMEMEMLEGQVPIVLIDRYYDDTKMSYVTTNNYQGGLDATNHLIARGHSKIACIQGVESSKPNEERVRGYRTAMGKAGLTDYAVVVGNEFSIQNGYLEAKLLLSRDDRPTAIFALSNTIMLGALKAIREAGLRIPQDIAVLSFDDNIYMDYMTPSITRIGQPVDDMAKLAVKILLDKLAGTSGSSSQLRLSPVLIAGESV